MNSPASITRPAASGSSSSGIGALPSAPQAREHPGHDVERAGAAMNPHEVGALLQSQGRKQSGNAEHVVEMAMRQQQPIEPAETDPAPQQLSLGALPAIHQDTVAARLHQKARMVAFCGWNAGRCPEKGQVEHDRSLTRRK